MLICFFFLSPGSLEALFRISTKIKFHHFIEIHKGPWVLFKADFANLTKACVENKGVLLFISGTVRSCKLI